MPAYHCDQCGLCCCSMIIQADVVDVMREPRIQEKAPISVNVGLPILGYTWVLNKKGRKECVFLEDGNFCEIYETRPSTCVQFQAGSERCQEIRVKNGLEPLEPVEDDSLLALISDELRKD